MYFILFYNTVDGYVEKRVPFRQLHLKYAEESVARGELILGGALNNPVDRAVLVFKADSPEIAEKFARSDPYVLNGLIKDWEVREWNVAIGSI